MGLRLSSGPAAEPLSTAEAKAHIALDASVTAFDTLIDRFVSAARESAERYTGRAFINQTWVLKRDKFPAWEILLPRPPLSSITSIQYVDEDGNTQTLAASKYQSSTNSEPGRVTPAHNETWPPTRASTLDAVTITYVAGYGASSSDVPEEIRQAVALTVGNWFEHREGVVTGTIATALPQSAKWLLDGLRIGAHAGWYELVGTDR